MNCKYFLFLLSFFMLPISAVGNSNARNKSVLQKIVNFPPEVSLDSDPKPDAYGMLQLDEARIETLYKKYDSNFKKRGYLKYGALVLQAGVIGLTLYNIGLLDSFLPSTMNLPFHINFGKKNSIDNQLQEFAKWKTEMSAWKEEIIKKFPELAKNMPASTSRFGWMWGGIKSLSSYLALSLFITKVAQINNYVEVEPTFAWFFSKHSISDRIEVLKRSVKALSDFNMPAIYSVEYHTKSIVPALQSLARNVEEFVAFMNYYFGRLDQNLVIKNGMESQSRYIYQMSNDFLKKMHDSLNSQPGLVTLALVDEYKADMVTCIKKCQFFERDLQESE